MKLAYFLLQIQNFGSNYKGISLNIKPAILVKKDLITGQFYRHQVVLFSYNKCLDRDPV